ncbi:hypothetical protein C4D60_Mb08t27370 [Musa balbisiana]|uniref:Uncharacterized protein n=1 Tax=Musa balbisiana TaxID=52838 RepID=A0A4S8K6V6_MUSBA|nr:hypothetical protein C4D60_Mb08t27370 [Musa balbisiana]
MGFKGQPSQFTWATVNAPMHRYGNINMHTRIRTRERRERERERNGSRFANNDHPQAHVQGINAPTCPALNACTPPSTCSRDFEVPSWTGLLGVECMQNSADRSRVGSRWEELGSLAADLRPWHGKFWSESKRGRRLTRADVGAASCAGAVAAAATNLFCFRRNKEAAGRLSSSLAEEGLREATCMHCLLESTATRDSPVELHPSVPGWPAWTEEIDYCGENPGWLFLLNQQLKSGVNKSFRYPITQNHKEFKFQKITNKLQICNMHKRAFPSINNQDSSLDHPNNSFYL